VCASRSRFLEHLRVCPTGVLRWKACVAPRCTCAATCCGKTGNWVQHVALLQRSAPWRNAWCTTVQDRGSPFRVKPWPSPLGDTAQCLVRKPQHRSTSAAHTDIRVSYADATMISTGLISIFIRRGRVITSCACAASASSEGAAGAGTCRSAGASQATAAQTTVEASSLHRARQQSRWFGRAPLLMPISVRQCGAPCDRVGLRGTPSQGGSGASQGLPSGQNRRLFLSEIAATFVSTVHRDGDRRRSLHHLPRHEPTAHPIGLRMPRRRRAGAHRLPRPTGGVAAAAPR
jgi:hypothetical protein